MSGTFPGILGNPLMADVYSIEVVGPISWWSANYAITWRDF